MPAVDLARLAASRTLRRPSFTSIGASLVVSTPAAMPLSICPRAILLAISSVVCRLVPQACWTS
jgi:hypothetical protein